MKIKFVFILLIAFISSYAQTEGELSVELTTVKTGGKYAPRNVMAIWIENDSGNFVKTLLAYGEKRKTHLNNWQKATSDAGSEFNVIDAVTGATQSNHGTRNCKWDGKNYKGTLVDDGDYKLCMELTDKNETGNYSIIDIIKSADEFTLSPADEASFNSIQINWLPAQTSAIYTQNINNEIKVFPNPSNGLIQITGKQIELIEINNINGENLYTGTETNFNLSNYSNGIYFLTVKTAEGIFNKKIVKQ